MSTLQNIANIPGRGSILPLWFFNAAQSFSLGTVKPKLRWHFKIETENKPNVVHLNAFLQSVIGSVTLWLALWRSIENGSNHVASLDTKRHLIFLFLCAAFKAYSNINTKNALKYLFHAIRWNPQVQLVSMASCSTWLRIFPENSTVSGRTASLCKT